ncbi:ABC-F family ATP-binding cassette domain-containing protein [Alcaligenes nematophilus]|uniref:ABC-F family ATP-binding cassette domain-containing protein n=1 Tax=Alcaligenes nematophilus TaxID=2994643 RepID=A0ABU3MNZ9_9BURK|nr:ABC-F family ATP-binding cassette domain-containing protein [Alcaligenes nematophilus]MDT8464236.1 ABC-F family ATP-binding cassette domain-containing protein [Alcaligenes nematophilus]MDT8469894.1 ABC-F family ATP-binding cassette domain-containing protein [Alcaligenes nematophilus]MDT8503005.1 ABC-F family ATP-binding cassette domain-containing protein [Alcaligenes nematophilus]MDT8525800.1 ABC-F family ATP-binding cassette domain-containing protein [Alcaligenes nematophilus]
MTNPYLTLEGVSYTLPQGKTLFSQLNETFDLRRTGLVGRNGAGKTILAQILAGEIQPSSGRCLRSGKVHYLAQQVASVSGLRVADLAGVGPALDALARIESGSSAVEDFNLIEDRWDIRQQLQEALERNGLGHLTAETPAETLSGGQAMRVSLINALLSQADFLILDEPSNHLDRDNRLALIEQLRHWPHGLLVISHDRQLLDTMEHIVELSSLGLRSYGGNYSHYAEQKALEQQSAMDQLEHRKLERQRAESTMQEQRQRQERRQARGNQQGKQANQAKILLDRQKGRSEATTGKLRQQHVTAQKQLAQRVQEAAELIEQDSAINLHALPLVPLSRQRVVELDEVKLPFAPVDQTPISMLLSGQQRIGVIGPNGCGKSTLLKVIAGQLAPVSGHCKVVPQHVYLDQGLADLDPQQTVLEQIQAVNRKSSEGDLRMRLAQLGLDAQKVTGPSAALSGGERLKAALACVLYADPPPQLLLLDEPSNHLDLPSTLALETMLSSYQGTLMVVSHDDAFMNNLGLTERLEFSEEGWRLLPW